MTHLKFINYAPVRILEAFPGALTITFCGLDECMGYKMAYYVVVKNFGTLYKVVVSEGDNDNIDMEVKCV